MAASLPLRRLAADFVAWCTAFIATLVLGVKLGIGIGVLMSMVLIVLRTARPNYAVLGRLPRTNIFRDLRRYSEATPIPGVLIFRFGAEPPYTSRPPLFDQPLDITPTCADGAVRARSAVASDGSLHFANKDYFYAAVSAAVGEWKERSPDGITVVAVEFSPVNDVDASALRMLADLLKELKEQRLRLLLSSCKGPVRDVMRHSGFLDAISPSSLCVSLAEAVKYGARLHAVRVRGCEVTAETEELTTLPTSPEPSPCITRRASSSSPSAKHEHEGDRAGVRSACDESALEATTFEAERV